MFRNPYFSSMGSFANRFPFGVPNITNSIGTTLNTAKTIGTASKFSFTGILENASKTINTINQIVPLYQQVKPMFSNAKTALNIFKNVKNINNIPTNNIPDNNNQNTIKNEEPIKEKKEIIDNKSIVITQTSPNKPFFV